MASEIDEPAVSIYSAQKRFAEESVAGVKAQTERRFNSIAYAENAERVVKLNVGGVHFDSTIATLSRCQYFRGMFRGKYNDMADGQSRIFIDREPYLFDILLTFMRSRMRPAEAIMKQIGPELLREAEYFAYDDFIHEVQGNTNPYDMRISDQQMLSEENDCVKIYQGEIDASQIRYWNTRLLKNVFSNSENSFLRHSRREFNLPLLFNLEEDDIGGPSRSISDLASFRNNFNKLTGYLLDHIENEAGIVFAGGSVLAALTGTTCSDIDIFIAGLNRELAEQRMFEIMRAVKKSVLSQGSALSNDPGQTEVKMLVSRSRLCVTMFRGGDFLPVQIILTLYRTPLEIILNFDIDCCCVLYDFQMASVGCLPRFRRSLDARCNIADTNMRSPNYEMRLEKYAARGFAIAVPGLRVERVNKDIYTEEYYLDPNTNQLFRMQPARDDCTPINHEASVWGIRFWQNHSISLTAQCQRVSHLVKGLERLLIINASSPPEGIAKVHRAYEFYEESLGTIVRHALLFQKAPLPSLVIALAPGQESAIDDEQVQNHPADEEVHDDDSYSEDGSAEIQESSPTSVLQRFLELFQKAHLATRQEFEVTTESEDLLNTIVETTLEQHYATIQRRFEHVLMRRLKLKRQLGAVYDVTSINDLQHTDLVFVVDARQGCLCEIPCDRFFEITGVNQLLQFETSLRRATFSHFGRQSQMTHQEVFGNWFRNVY